jgi:hypothetical protein
MVDKFVDQDAKKERFSIQMEFRKKSLNLDFEFFLKVKVFKIVIVYLKQIWGKLLNK